MDLIFQRISKVINKFGYSHWMDALEQVSCYVPLTRELPGCEHFATLPCSQDPLQYRCPAPCGGIMACCGRSCKFQCSQCQNENIGNDEQIQRKKRIQHVGH